MKNLIKKKRKSDSISFFAALYKSKKVAFVCMFILLGFLLTAIFASELAPQKMVNGILESHLIEGSKPPSFEHLLGTDGMGRDLLSYMIYGARTSVILGVFCTLIATAISVVLGVASAVIGGKFDLILQRFVDAWQCVPGMLIMLIMMSVLGSGLVQLILVISIPAGIAGSRMMRSAAFAVKDSGYCKMSTVLGGGNLWRMWRHVFPNIMPMILMNLANSLGGVIMMESTMNFLGFGVDLNTPSWGNILTSQGTSKMFSAPWIGIVPGIAIMLMVFAAAMFGDGVRDVLDPRLKGGVGTMNTKKIKKIVEKYASVAQKYTLEI